MEFLSLDLGGMLGFIIERVATQLVPSKDEAELRQRIVQRVRLSTEEASTVQCIGMARPIPITDIYQPPRLVSGNESIDVESLVASSNNSIIFASPGMGKTTLLQWIYIRLARTSNKLPLLFSLRSPRATEDLQYLVEKISERKKEIRAEEELLKRRERQLREAETRVLDPKSKIDERERVMFWRDHKRQSREINLLKDKLKQVTKEISSVDVIFLVDGYDEISEGERRNISQLLVQFSSLECGHYVLTCRTFYDVYYLKADQYLLRPFTLADAERFVAAFSTAYQAPMPSHLLDDMIARGFKDFVLHPLMLALVCILMSSSTAMMPRSSLFLLRRALDVLTFRWDESRGIHRDSSISLDGEQRIQCAMRLAFFMELDQLGEHEAEAIVQDYLRLSQVTGVSSRVLLREIAQWYGIIYQNAELDWRFSHKTIHDFLAARHWVESGTFVPSQVKAWNARAGYAACLTPDATQSAVYALRFSKDITAFVEMLANQARFVTDQIASVVAEHFEKFREFIRKRTEEEVMLDTWQDFFPFASEQLLIDLLARALKHEGPLVSDLLIGYTCSEMVRRGTFPGDDVVAKLAGYHPLRNIRFRVKRTVVWHAFGVEDVLSLNRTQDKSSQSTSAKAEEQ